MGKDEDRYKDTAVPISTRFVSIQSQCRWRLSAPRPRARAARAACAHASRTRLRRTARRSRRAPCAHEPARVSPAALATKAPRASQAAVLGLRDHEPAQQGPRTPAVLRQPTAAQLLPLARAGSLRHRISQVSALLQSPCQRPRYIGWETSRASPTQSSATTFRTPPRPRAAMTASSCAGAAG